MKGCKKILAFGIAAALTLAGCQATPKEDVVVNKGEGLPEGALAEEVSEPRFIEGAPEHWKESIDVGDEGRLTIEADATVNIPEIINTPILELEPKEFTQKELESLVEYFAGDSKLYVNQYMTREELETRKKKIQSEEGEYGEDWAKQNKKKYLKNIDALLEKQPRDNPGKTYVSPSFENKLTQREIDNAYIRTGVEKDSNTTNNFKVIIEEGENAGGGFRAQTYDKEDGAMGVFHFYTIQGESAFNEGYLRDSKDLFQSSKAYGEDTPYNQSHGALLDALGEKIEQPDEKEEDAIEIAKNLLKDLNIEGMEMEKTKGYLYLPEGGPIYEDSEDAMWNADIEAWKCGYEIVFSRGAEGIPTLIYHNGIIGGSTPDTLYTPSFAPESVTVRIGNGKILDFEWKNMSRVTKTIALNTNLVDFETIKNRFCDHVYYSSVAEATAHNDMGVSYQADVSDVRFGYCLVTAYEEPDKVWMVPSWTFELYVKGTYGDGNYSGSLTEYNCFNALDGGYITLDNVTLR